MIQPLPYLAMPVVVRLSLQPSLIVAINNITNTQLFYN